jgi:hypothetical protein
MKKLLWFLAALGALGAVIMIARSRRQSGTDFDYSEWGPAPSDLTGRVNEAAKSGTTAVSNAADSASASLRSAAKDATETVKAAAKDAKEAATS